MNSRDGYEFSYFRDPKEYLGWSDILIDCRPPIPKVSDYLALGL